MFTGSLVINKIFIVLHYFQRVKLWDITALTLFPNFSVKRFTLTFGIITRLPLLPRPLPFYFFQLFHLDSAWSN